MAKANVSKLTAEAKVAAKESRRIADSASRGDDGICLKTCAKLTYHTGSQRDYGKRGFYVRGYSSNGDDIAPYI